VEDAPPVITLDLASADVDPTGTRDVERLAVRGEHITAPDRKGKACQVLTANAVTCPIPTASAFDHHDEAAVFVDTRMVLYIESMPRSRPAKVFTAVTEGSYSQRGEYIIYYDPKYRAGNHAEAIAYGMIMEDHVKPVLQLPIESSTIEACDSSQQYIELRSPVHGPAEDAAYSHGQL